MVVTFPHMGNAYISVKALLDEFDINYIIPSFNNRKTAAAGSQHAPEFACLPLKVTLGNLLEGYSKGADTVLMVGGKGPCRFGYYCEMFRETLEDAGCKMDLITLEAPYGDYHELLRRVKRLTRRLKPLKTAKAILYTARTANMADELERLCAFYRPREKEKGITDRINRDFKYEALNTKGFYNMWKLIGKTKKRLLGIEYDKGFKPIKIGIVGEIYTNIDCETGFNLEGRLGNMGFDTGRYITVSGWIVEHMIKKALHLPKDRNFITLAKPYLGAMIGGHARETVGNIIDYKMKGFDGVIQIYPLTCMPEIVAQSIIPEVSRKFDIPVLTLVIDEINAEAGYITRLEAFTDMLVKRRERKEGCIAGNVILE